MTYGEQLHALGEETSRQVLSLWELVPDELDPEDFDELAAIVIATAAAQGAVLAELSLVATVAAESGSVAAPVTVAAPTHHVDTRRLAVALSTAREDTGTATQRLSRLARSEPVESSQRAYSRAIAAEPKVKGWTRQLDSDPCQLCTWWHRDGRVWPSSHPMPTHKGCECSPRAVLAHGIKPVVT